jgi:hypothetical protein
VTEAMSTLSVKAVTSVRVETPSAGHSTNLTETRKIAIVIAHPLETSSALAVYSQQVAAYQTDLSDSVAGRL